MDDGAAAAQFLLEVGVRYPQVVDVGGEVLNDVRVPGLPATVVLDADGRIVGKHIGELTQESIDDLWRMFRDTRDRRLVARAEVS